MQFPSINQMDSFHILSHIYAKIHISVRAWMNFSLTA
jgi:hypothetical protein